MEKFKMLEKNGILFNVGNQGTIQVISEKRKKYIRTLKKIEDFSQIGGHKDNRYLSTYGQYIHRLVAEVWIGPIPEGMTVNHKDLDKFNNDVENLEIVTYSENIRHAYEAGAHDHWIHSKHEHQEER